MIDDWDLANALQQEATEKVDNYTTAMQLKKNGNYLEAARLLETSCKPPSIYKGHYRELFKIWRILNKQDLSELKYKDIIKRILKMQKYDDQMIQKMLKYWSKVQKTTLPENYFDGNENLKITDAKTLLKAAMAINDEESIKIAQNMIQKFASK